MAWSCPRAWRRSPSPRGSSPALSGSSGDLRAGRRCSGSRPGLLLWLGASSPCSPRRRSQSCGGSSGEIGRGGPRSPPREPRWSSPHGSCRTSCGSSAPWYSPPTTARPSGAQTAIGPTAARALGSWSVFCLVIEPETVGLEPSRRSAHWRNDGITYARDHTDRVPLVVGARVGRSLDLFGLDYQVDEDVRDGRPRWASWTGVVSFWILAPLAVAGAVRWRGVSRGLLLAPVLAVGLSTIVLYGGHRIRAPLEPIVVLAAAGASVHLVTRRLRRQPPPEAIGIDARLAEAATGIASPHGAARPGPVDRPAAGGPSPLTVETGLTRWGVARSARRDRCRRGRRRRCPARPPRASPRGIPLPRSPTRCRGWPRRRCSRR